MQLSLYHTLTYLDIESDGRLKTKLYDRSGDFNFPIVSFPFICSNILVAHAYGVYISCGSYHDFLYKLLLLTGNY